MKRQVGWRSALCVVAMCAIGAAPAEAVAWESTLYPSDWTPGFSDADDRFLHDFSYAGYHASEDPIPDMIPGQIVNVTDEPYLADRFGNSDTTAAIQAAIDDVGAAGGGVVYLPAGTYSIRPPAGRNQALLIDKSGVVLRGDGPDATRLLNLETVMRSKVAVRVAPREDYYAWIWNQADTRLVTTDLAEPTTVIPVDDVAGYTVGEWIVVMSDATNAWIADHGMTGVWTPQDISGPAFYRTIVAIDAATNTVTVDAPTRYPLLTRDNARIGRLIEHIEEVGIESLGFGNAENTTSGVDTDDYNRPGTGGYEMHASFAFYFNHAVNSWMRDVRTFRPGGNNRDIHTLSNGIRMDFSRWITLERVEMFNAQYQGAGGNGYHFVLTGNDCLIADSHAEAGRHNYSFAFPWANGNVIHNSSARGGRLPVDFHQRLSIANLIDHMTVDDDYIEGLRRECCNHGHSATENVFWNTVGTSYQSDQWPWENRIVESQQFGQGYVIGTSGAASAVMVPGGDGTDPVDFTEGVGEGDTLEPWSLFLSQRAKRLGLPPIEPPDDPVDPPDEPVNMAPIVNAGDDVTIAWTGGPVVVDLLGTVEDDSANLTIEWTLAFGPSVAVFDDANQATTTVTLDQPGVYFFRLRADDGEHEILDDLTVTIGDALADMTSAMDASDTQTNDIESPPDTDHISDVGAGPDQEPGEGDAGCGCQIATHNNNSPSPWVGLVAILGWLFRRQRQQAANAHSHDSRSL